MKTKLENVPGRLALPLLGPVYARFFSSGVLRELARKGRSAIAARLAGQHCLFDRFGANTRVGEFYDAIFKCLIHEYRHEYVYKNAIAEKILLGRHNLNTAFMLTEFRADDCKADAVVLNGTSHVYEIKSEMDSFDRLDRQLAAYRKMFDYITVITTERLFEPVAMRTPKEIGITVLAGEGDKWYRFRKTPHREAESNRGNVQPPVILRSLQRPEYLQIIKESFGISLAHLPNTQIYSEAKRYFEKLTPDVAHAAMVEALKRRRDTWRAADFVTEVPRSLKAATLSIRLTTEDGNRFIDVLRSDIKSAFT